jgi:uncharacterized membrane protein HdeD (DUF308 family)
MLAALSIHWPLLRLRASVGVVFGLAALLWPDILPSQLARLFGAYAAADGALAMALAVSVTGEPGSGSLLVEAIIRLGVAAFAFASPGRIALAFPAIFSAWAIASGASAIAVAISLPARDWPLPFAGAVSVLCGVLLPIVGAPDPRWVFGPYAILFGWTMLALALRLRRRVRRIVHA